MGAADYRRRNGDGVMPNDWVALPRVEGMGVVYDAGLASGQTAGSPLSSKKKVCEHGHSTVDAARRCAYSQYSVQVAGKAKTYEETVLSPPPKPKPLETTPPRRKKGWSEPKPL